MSLTPNDIIEREFSLKLRGYDRDEVDAFLEEAASALAAVIRERNSLKDQNIAYENKITGLLEKQHDVTEAITAVHKMAEDMKAKATKEAELIVNKAKMEAERIVSDAHKEALSLEERVMRLRRIQREAIMKTRNMIQGYLDMLDDAAMNLPPENITSVMHSTAADIRDMNRESGYEEKSTESVEKEEGKIETITVTDSSGETFMSETRVIEDPESIEEIFLAGTEGKKGSHINKKDTDTVISEDGERDTRSMGFKPEKLMP